MEMEAYSRFVTVDSYMLVQDGVIDIMPTLRSDRPGPLPAIRQFLRGHPEFEIDRSRSSRFLVTHHPLGWLRRLPDQPYPLASATDAGRDRTRTGHSS